jgi:malate dehydrogenase
MREVAIIGAGELGGAVAHALARQNVAPRVRLIDDTGRIAEGKALDISQASPVEGFATRVCGAADLIEAAGAEIIVVADRAGRGEWQGEEAIALLRRLRQLAPYSIVVCAGAGQRELVDRSVRELHFPREVIVGSAPEALVAAARTFIALDRNASASDVAVSVLGAPPDHIVVSWDTATLGGFAVTRLIDEPSRHRIAKRIAAAWPPGALALAAAGAKAVGAMLNGSRRLMCCFVAPDDRSGVRTRTAALPVSLGPAGVREVVLPPLSVAERVALDNAVAL